MELITISQAAALLEVSRQAVDLKLRAGDLTLYKVPGFAGQGRVAEGGRRMVDKAEVEALKTKREK